MPDLAGGKPILFTQAERLPLRTVAVVTRDRPAELRRSLRSHAEHAREHGRAFRLLVLDNSLEPAVQEQNRATLREAGQLHPALSTEYLGVAEKRAFAAALAQTAQLPAPIAEFALLGLHSHSFQGGANTNAFFLQIAGECGLCFDDDVACQVAAPAGMQTDWTFSPEFDSTEFDFFTGQEESFAAASWAEEDVYSRLHEPLGSAAMEGGDTTPVLFSTLGLRGDSGMRSHVYQLKLTGANRDRLVGRGAERFVQALESRQIGRGVRRPTLQRPGYFQNYAFGVESRAGLPPFLPVLRAGDAFFSWTTRTCWARAWAAYLPWQIRHAPPGGRRTDLQTFANEAGYTLFDHWFAAALQCFPDPAEGEVETPESRLIALGRLFVELSRLPLPEVERVFGNRIRGMHQQEVATLERRLQEFAGEPACWAAQVEAYREALLRNLSQPLFYAPARQFPHAVPSAENAREALALLGDFGILLQYWPALQDAARVLRQRG